MKNLAEARIRLELAAKRTPALRRLLDGAIDGPEDLEPMAAAVAELGLFELSFLLRAIAAGGADLQANVAKLAFFVSSTAEGEFVDDFVKNIMKGHDARELGELLELFRKLPR